MAYTIDVLISYSGQDNTSEEGSGWVDDFKHFLELMLEQVLGNKPNVVLRADDDSLTGSDLNDVGVLVPILSQNFLSSGQCLDYLEEFGRHVENSEQDRIFKVFRNSLTYEQTPSRLRGMNGYEMFKVDADTGESRDYQNYFDSEAANNYWMHIVDLAFDIHESLIALSGKQITGQMINERKTVYLAETAHDLIVQRNIIRRELQRHGYRVLPDHPLPHQSGELEKQVQENLDNSSLSIHLIGTSYGEIPEGTDKSVVDLQNKLSSDKAKAEGKVNFPRLIWITPAQRLASEKQRAFIENVKRDSDVSDGAEILQTPLEDFKNLIRTEVIEGGLQKKKDVSTTEKDNSGKSIIYLIHDKVDTEKAAGIQGLLEKSGFGVLTPKFEGELLDVREDHISNLRRFDGAIVFQGNVNPQWVRMKVLDLLKAPGFGRKKPVLGRALVSSNNAEFEGFAQQGIQLIDDDGNVQKSLESFLEDLKK